MTGDPELLADLVALGAGESEPVALTSVAGIGELLRPALGPRCVQPLGDPSALRQGPPGRVAVFDGSPSSDAAVVGSCIEVGMPAILWDPEAPTRNGTGGVEDALSAWEEVARADELQLVRLDAHAIRPWLAAAFARSAAMDLTEAAARDEAAAAADAIAGTALDSAGTVVAAVLFPADLPDWVPRPPRGEEELGSLGATFLAGELRRSQGRLDQREQALAWHAARERRLQAQVDSLSLRYAETLIELSDARDRRDYLQRQLDGHMDSFLWSIVVRLWRIRARVRSWGAAARRVVVAPFRRDAGDGRG